jgi:U3 small nucleolar RNA-associated protein 13
VFKHSNQLVVQMVFDPTSKFLATGTSDSHIKIFDVVGGFQTHNFMGHRGLIVKMVFYPGESSLKLISTGEDFIIKVWDLVLKKEVAVMKPKGKEDNMAHMTTSLCFTKDRKTLISSGRDGQIHFWNAIDNFKLISSLQLSSIGCDKEEEILSMQYLAINEDPCIVLGGHSGNVYVYSIKK